MAIFFEWDEFKNAANLRKHGISFEEAIKIFDDPGLSIRAGSYREWRGAMAKFREDWPAPVGNGGAHMARSERR